MEKKNKPVSRSEKKDAVQKNINGKKTTKILDKLMFEKTTGLGSKSIDVAKHAWSCHTFCAKEILGYHRFRL